MKATSADQRVLLDVADIDRRLVQAAAQRKNPPQAARITELSALRQKQAHELTMRSGARDDIRTEIERIESDAETARTRLSRDEERLATASAKEAVALESEIASLRRRLSTLEDGELEAMERLEDAETAVVEQQAVIAETTAEGTLLTSEAKALVGDATELVEQLTRDRAAVIAAIPAALVAQYDRIARNTTAAGLFRGGMCEACRVILSGSDLAEVRRAPDDEVIFCPECGAILVRTEESGL